jgi:hypothetical protein
MLSFADLMSSPHLTIGSPIEENDPISFHIDSPSSPTIPLTGRPNNPGTPSGSNDPGLGASLSPTRPRLSIQGASNVKNKWLWIALILVALLAVYYWFLQPGAAA